MHLTLSEMGDFGPHAFEPWSSQMNDLQIYACHFLDKCSPLLGKGKDWSAQCQDNVTEWDIGSEFQQADFPVG